jgi:hypothetical protein
MKPAVTNIVPVTVTLGSVNVASQWNVLDEGTLLQKEMEGVINCIA